MIKQLIAISLLLNVASATITASSASASASNFVNSTVNVVWSTANATDTKWTGNSFQSLTTFGPATSTVGTGTVYAYAVNLAATKITVTSRSLNSSILINGTSTTEGSLLVDNSASATAVAASKTDGSAAVCPGMGSIGVIYSDTDAAHSYLNLWAFVYSASGSASTPVQLSAGTSVAAAATTSGIVYYGLRCTYDTSGVYYFAWGTQATTYTATGGGSTTYSDNGVFIQGINTTNSNALLWSKAVVPGTQPTNTGSSGVSTLSVQIGLSNMTNATTAYLAYRSVTSTAGLYATMVLPVTISTGTAGSTVTAATDVAVTTPAAGFLNYMPIGFITSTNSTASVLIQNASTVTSTSAVTYALTQYNISNSTGSASLASVSSSCIPTTATGGEYGSAGYFIVLGCAVKSGSTATYSYQTFNYTSAIMSSASTLAQVPYANTVDFTPVSPGTAFVDTMGGLWFGYTVTDTTSANTATYQNAVAGYLGEVTTSTWSTSSTSFGSLISASFSLFALIAAAVLAF